MEKEFLIAQLAEKKTTVQIAELSNCSETNVRKWLKRYSLQAAFVGGKRSWTDEQMRSAIVESITVSDVLKKLNLTVRPGNYETVRNFVKKHQIDTSHFIGKKSGRGGNKIRPLNEIFVVGSTYKRQDAKRRLISEGLLKNKCAICGSDPEWRGEPMILILDHINGTNDDNRVENLRLLCPNCNSQQPTFCGRNTKSDPKRCINCNVVISRASNWCKKCHGLHMAKTTPRKVVNRPSKEELSELLSKNTWESVAKMFGVTSNSVRSWMTMYERT